MYLKHKTLMVQLDKLKNEMTVYVVKRENNENNSSPGLILLNINMIAYICVKIIIIITYSLTISNPFQ